MRRSTAALVSVLALVAAGCPATRQARSVAPSGFLGADASLLRLERDDEAVELVTLHTSKGLEYPVVYLPCLWEGGRTLRKATNGRSSDITGTSSR